MSGSFSEHLPHFAVKRFGDVALGKLVNPFGRPPPPPPEEGRTGAEERAIREAVEAAKAEFQLERAEADAAFEMRLAEVRREVSEEAAAALAERLTTAIAEIGASVSTHVAIVLARFVDGAVRRRALDELAETIGALTADSAAARIRVSGPASLLEPLQARLATLGAAIEYSMADTADVHVRIDETVIETRIAAWAAHLAEAADGESGAVDV